MIGDYYFEWEYFENGDFETVILNLILKVYFQKNDNYFEFNFEMRISNFLASLMVVYGFLTIKDAKKKFQQVTLSILYSFLTVKDAKKVQQLTHSILYRFWP